MSMPSTQHPQNTPGQGLPTLRALREAKNWSVEKLAAETDLWVSASTIRRIEAGDTSPERRTREILAKALGVDPIQVGWPV
jgi:transcriptional regulator with XRE-family HTH domain